MKVLIAEDDATSRLIMQRAVEREGHDCLLAPNGAEAWQLYLSSDVDVVISDWMMPDMDGVQLSRLVRSQTDRPTYPYIIMVTALGDREHFLSAMEQGVDDFLTKPVNALDLKIRLRVADRVTFMSRQLAEQRAHMEYLSLHDALTGLPNRVLFADRLRHALQVARRTQRPVAVLLLDLDGFKPINDTLGHARGDELLQAVGTRLRESLRGSDTVARLGGDEFGVVLPDNDGAAAEKVARKILQVLSPPVPVDGGEVSVGCSIGIALYPDHGVDAAELLPVADAAMYVAKGAGSGYALAPVEDAHHDAGLRHAEVLRAIEAGEIDIHWRLVVDVQSSQPMAVTGALSWRHAERGVLPTSAVWVQAAQEGVAARLGDWVLQEAMARGTKWVKARAAIPMFVPLGPGAFDDPDLGGRIRRRLEALGLHPSLFGIVLPDRSGSSDVPVVEQLVRELRSVGVHVGIRVRHLELIQVDKVAHLASDILLEDGIVHDAVGDAEKTNEISSLIRWAHGHGQRVIARGVNLREHWHLLAALGCDLAQGDEAVRRVANVA